MKRTLLIFLTSWVCFINPKCQPCYNNIIYIGKTSAILNEIYSVLLAYGYELNPDVTWYLYENNSDPSKIFEDGKIVATGNYKTYNWSTTKTVPGTYNYCFKLIGNYGTCTTEVSSIKIYQPLSPNQYNKVISNSVLAFNGYKNHLYYINTNRYICALWYDGYNWQDAILSQTMKSIGGNSGLAVNTNTQDIYYIGEDRKIYKQRYSNGAWSASKLALAQSDARGDSKLVINKYFNKVYYINNSNQICALWFDGSNWYDAVINAVNIKPAYTGYGLCVSYDNQGTDLIYYVSGTDAKIYKLAYNYSSRNYVCTQLCSGQNTVNLYSDIIKNSGYNLFYINSKRQLCCLWSYDGITYGDAVLSGSVLYKEKTRLAYDKVNDNLYFINSDYYVFKYPGKDGTSVSPAPYIQLDVDGSILFDAGNLYISHDFFQLGIYDRRIYKLDPLGSLKSAEFELTDNENENIIKDNNTNQETEVFPNPTTGIVNINNLKNNSTIEVYDNLGKLVYRNTKLIDTKIDLTGKQKGIYYFKIIGNSRTVCRKILLQ